MRDVYPIPEFLRRPVEAPRERPILFSAPMIKALLAGAKTQTRRIVKPQPPYQPVLATHLARRGYPVWHTEQWQKFCPYGQPGDRLWVRETWRTDAGYNPYSPNQIDSGASLFFLADQCAHRINHRPECGPHEWGKTRVSIHMPRWASRILLEIVSVRVERLNDISEADAIAEGTTSSIVGQDLDHLKYRAGYQTLWESINGAGSWERNDWVWVLEFRMGWASRN